jgi:hypothetical protein
LPHPLRRRRSGDESPRHDEVADLEHRHVVRLRGHRPLEPGGHQRPGRGGDEHLAAARRRGDAEEPRAVARGAAGLVQRGDLGGLAPRQRRKLRGVEVVEHDVDGHELRDRGVRQPGTVAEEPVHRRVVRDQHGHGVPAVDLGRDAGVGEEEVEELEIRVPVEHLRDVERRVAGIGGVNVAGGCEEESDGEEREQGEVTSHANARTRRALMVDCYLCVHREVARSSLVRGNDRIRGQEGFKAETVGWRLVSLSQSDHFLRRSLA